MVLMKSKPEQVCGDDEELGGEGDEDLDIVQCTLGKCLQGRKEQCILLQVSAVRRYHAP